MTSCRCLGTISSSPLRRMTSLLEPGRACQGRQAAGTLDHGAQRLALLNRVGSREADLAFEGHLVLLGPAGDLLDRQAIERLQRDISALIAAADRSQIDR